MPPSKFPPPQLKPPIGTRTRNKNVHPGKVQLDAQQSRRTKQEMEKVRAQMAQQAEEKKTRLANNLKNAAQIEDELQKEDVERHTSNHRSQGIMPFNPHLPAVNNKGSDMEFSSTKRRSKRDSSERELSSTSEISHLIWN